MTYTVFARKYRPQTFADLVGQEHVSRTLGNAIRSERVAHAFLFTGVRGVGKTTTARLLAKALDCVKGPTPEPCNACDPCLEITQGRDLDVLEIDGASNNSVEDVRRLQESLPYRPARDRYKVVIVDEVHMLSTGAFNAFLKTLEEPPAHVKFIFATTEAHKVPVTIRSRCQRYDFRLIPRQVIAQRVREILEAEQIQTDDAAIALVAREAAGSMRDALTLLDQLVAFSGQSLVGSEVAEHLGIADRTLVLDAARALLEGDAAACLRSVDQITQQGVDLLHFARRLLELVRDLVVLRVVGDDQELVDLVDEERDAARGLAERRGPQDLERLFAGLSRVVDEVGLTSTPKLVLEMGLVRLAEQPALVPLAELVAKLESLEARLTGGQPPPVQRGSGPGGQGGSPGGGPGGSRGGPEPARNPPSRPRPAPRMSRPEATATELVPAEAVAIEAGAAEAVAVERAPAPIPRAAAPERDARPAPTAGADAGSPVPTPGARPAPTAGLNVRSNGKSAWSRVVAELEERDAILGAALRTCAVPIEVGPRLVLGIAKGHFIGKKVSAPDAQAALAACAAEVLGQRPEVEVRFVDQVEGLGPTLAQASEGERKAQRAEREERARNHPMLRELLEVFPECRGRVQVQVD